MGVLVGVLVGRTTVEFAWVVDLMLVLLRTTLDLEEVLYTETGTLVVELVFRVIICVELTGADVGTWIWPSLICVMGFRLVATDVATCDVGFPEEAPAEPAADEDFGSEGFEFEMPNWVEYWNCPVPVTMICKP